MGAENIRKFQPRAFRYVLRPQDKHVMRFSLQESQGPQGIEQTPLINLSETGVAFLVNPDTDIKLGDAIKVEIPVPESEQIAWWGRVVRVQEYEPQSWIFARDPFRDEPKVIVGVRFEDMPDGHTRAIRKGIEQSFMRAMREQQYRNWLYYRTLALQNIGKAVLAVALTIAFIGVMWLVTRPFGNYDPEKGSPWGERFK